MSVVTTFDTYNFIAQLKNAGMEEKQAVAIADGLKEIRKVDREHLASKEDIEKLELRLIIKIPAIIAGILGLFKIFVTFFN